MASSEHTCRKDGKPMYFVEETEKLSNGVYRVTFSYKCVVCGYRIVVEYATIKKAGEKIIVERRVLHYS
ncbi:MAG: hypothetical protein DRO13_04720 [Thermoprotei archaeon]|nr:MAG: hypothetical protein DRO13_04720 [Thermoprotei archaeon]